jgi:hypothetical protein
MPALQRFQTYCGSDESGGADESDLHDDFSVLCPQVNTATPIHPVR